MHNIAQEARYALRQLRRNAGLTTVAIVALALGIGLSVVIFSIFYNGVLYPFPYRDARRLTVIGVRDARNPGDYRSVYRLDEVAAFRRYSHTFDDIVAMGSWDVAYREGNISLPVHGCALTPNAMSFWGVPPLLGRGITDNDAKSGAPPVVLLNYAYWKSMFHSDKSVVGKTMMLDRQMRTIIGVMPPRFALYGADVYIPIAWDRPEITFAQAITSSDPFFFFATGIRKAGVSFESAAADLQPIVERIDRKTHEDLPEHPQMFMRSMNQVIAANFKPTLYLLIAAVVLLLLISSSNVASLLLMQHTARARDTSVRAALGASRPRLIRQFLLESLILGLAGCVAGCTLAWLGFRFVTLTPAFSLPGEADISLNGPVLFFAVVLSLITTLLFGILPALFAVRKGLWQNLQSTGVNVSVNKGGAARAGLVVFQVALSMLLLVFAGLMMRSFMAVTQVDTGIRPDTLWTAEMNLPPNYYMNIAAQGSAMQGSLDRIERLPGVANAAISLGLPLMGGPATDDITIPGKPHDKKWFTAIDAVSAGYFRTLGLPVLFGRTMTAPEVAANARVAVVNRAFVKEYFGAENPIGRQVKFNAFDRWPSAPKNTFFQIIGVVGDFKNRGVNEAVQPEAFIPYTAATVPFHILLVRTAEHPGPLEHGIREAVAAVEPNLMLAHPATVNELLDQGVYLKPRYRLISFGICAAIGLGLSLIGLFGVLAYSVTLHTHDFGIRIAVGAQRVDILALVLRKGLFLVCSGIVIGLIVSLAGVRYVRSQIEGVSAFDWAAFSIAAGTLFATGVLACIIPARRATRVDPLVSLRHD